MQIRGLKNKDELNDLYKLYEKVFKKTPMAYFKNRIVNDPYLKLNDIRVAIEDNKIVSSIIIYRRKMYWNDEIISFGGVGNVSTLPEYGGKGFSTKVLNDAFNYMKELGFPLTILFAGINGFYERLGFKTIAGFYSKFKIRTHFSSNKNIREFRQEDLKEVHELYESFNQKRTGTLIRDIAYWKANLNFAERNEQFFVALKDDKIVAYIRFVPDYLKNEIFEFAYSEINSFSDLLLFIANMLNKSEISTSALVPQGFFDFENNEKMEVSYTPNTISMYRELFKGIEQNLGISNNYTFWWSDNF